MVRAMRCLSASAKEVLFAEETVVALYALSSGRPVWSHTLRDAVQTGSFTQSRVFVVTERAHLYSLPRHAFEPTATWTLPAILSYTALLVMSTSPLQLGVLARSGDLWWVYPQEERVERLSLSKSALLCGCVGQGNLWMIADAGGQVYVGKAQELVKRWAGGTGGIAAMAVHPSEPWVAGAGMDGLLRVWEYPSGRLLKALAGHRWDVRSVAFAQQGDLLVSLGSDRQVLVWRWRQAELPVQGLKAPVSSEMACLHRDGQGQVWLLSEEGMHRLELPTYKWHSVKLSPLKSKPD